MYLSPCPLFTHCSFFKYLMSNGAVELFVGQAAKLRLIFHARLNRNVPDRPIAVQPYHSGRAGPSAVSTRLIRVSLSGKGIRLRMEGKSAAKTPQRFNPTLTRFSSTPLLPRDPCPTRLLDPILPSEHHLIIIKVPRAGSPGPVTSSQVAPKRISSIFESSFEAIQVRPEWAQKTTFGNGLRITSPRPWRLRSGSFCGRFRTIQSSPRWGPPLCPGLP